MKYPKSSAETSCVSACSCSTSRQGRRSIQEGRVLRVMCGPICRGVPCETRVNADESRFSLRFRLFKLNTNSQLVSKNKHNIMRENWLYFNFIPCSIKPVVTGMDTRVEFEATSGIFRVVVRSSQLLQAACKTTSLNLSF